MTKKGRFRTKRVDPCGIPAHQCAQLRLVLNKQPKPIIPMRKFILLALMAVSSLHAADRRFAYLYEVTTAPKGTVEFETWATWKKIGDADKFDIRHEVEIGLTDRIQLGLYLADWTHRDPSFGGKSTEYTGSAIEVIGNLTDPVTDLLGSALYGEIKAGPDLLKLEGKILLQKNFGPLVAAYNGTIEAEWEGEDLNEEVGELAQSFGLSYQIAPWLTAGAELLHEVELPDWSKGPDSVVYAGPNISVRYKQISAVLAPLAQLTNVDGEPDLQTRLIFGFKF